MPATAQDFYLSAFEANLSLGVSGELAGALSVLADASAVAVYEIDLAATKLAFRFQSDASDVNDLAAQDIKYYVYKNDFPSLTNSVAGSMLDHPDSSGAIATGYADNKMFLKHDYIRYLALRLFNTHHGVDLFSNETALVNDISSNAATVVSHITGILTAVDISGSGTGMSGAANNYYFNDDASANNICQKVLSHMIKADPSRFSALSSAITPLPFIENDSLNFNVTVKAATGQHNLTSVAAIPDRVYRIKLLLKASPSNTVLVD